MVDLRDGLERTMTELRSRGDAWADADSAFRALDDTTKSVLSQCMADHEGDPVSKAEALARRDERYLSHLQALATARRAANKARVSYDVYRTFIDLKRSQMATERAEMNLR